MKNKKLTFLGLVATGLIITSLSSCGGGGSSDSGAIEVSFWHTFGQEIQREVQRQADKFVKIVKEQEGVDVKITPMNKSYQGNYDDIQDKIVKSFSIGTTPTISVAYPDHVANYLSIGKQTNNDYVVNLETLFNDPEIGYIENDPYNPNGLGETDFVESFLDEGRHYMVEGTYSLPYQKSTEIMLYNKDILATVLYDMGIQQSTDIYMENITWDDFMDLLKFVKNDLEKYFPNSTKEDVRPLFYDSDSNLFITQCYQRGIPFIGMENGKGTVDFDNPEAHAMVQEFKDLYDSGILKTKATNGNKYGSDYFKNLQCLFVVGSTGGTGYNDLGASGNVGVCKFPAYKTATSEQTKYVSQGVTLTLLNNTGIDKAVNDKRVEYGWKFMKYLTSTENNMNSALASEGYIPSRKSSYLIDEYQEYINDESEGNITGITANVVINEINGNYFNYPVFKGSDAARDQVGGIIAEYLSGKSSDLDALFSQAVSNTKKQMDI